MTLDELKDIDVSNLSTMDEKTRQETIMIGFQLYISSIEDAAKRLGISFDEMLVGCVLSTEYQMERLIEEEKYELCFFLNEIITKIKENYGLRY